MAGRSPVKQLQAQVQQLQGQVQMQGYALQQIMQYTKDLALIQFRVHSEIVEELRNEIQEQQETGDEEE